VSGFSPATIRALKKRSKGLCEGCGLSEATEAHHCQFRSRLGPDTLGNALHLCGSGNHTGCHGIAHSGYRGESLGWAIRSRHNPLLVPKFRTFDSTWWRYDNDGGAERVPAVDALEYLALIGAVRQGMP
jgi:hypothetical protein